MTVSDERLQKVVNLKAKLKEDHLVAKAADIKPSSIERLLREARVRNITAEISPEDPIVPPNIIILDVENSPSLAAVWGIHKQFLNTQQIVQEWYMFSWALKYLHGTEIHSDVVTPEESLRRDDSRIMESLWEFIDYADIIIGHNLDRFDKLKINSRFLQHGLNPPSSYETVDTLKVAKSQFSFTSNKLDYLCRLLGIPRKIDNGGIERWIRCMDGSPEDLMDMEKYNRHDITITEDLYLKLRPYIKSHPNLGLYYPADIDCCYKCGSIDIDWLYKENGEAVLYKTTVNAFPEYRCNICQSVGRSRYSAFEPEQRRHVTAPVAR